MAEKIQPMVLPGQWATITAPTAMNAAKFIVCSGVMVQRTCGPEITAVTLSGGSFDLTSSIQ